jgi:hypothetical protein
LECGENRRFGFFVFPVGRTILPSARYLPWSLVAKEKSKAAILAALQKLAERLKPE